MRGNQTSPRGLPGNSFTDLFALSVALKGPSLKVLQIGAYDGKSFDPIYPVSSVAACEITLVEPNPEAITALKRNYGNFPTVNVIEAAVTDGQEGNELALYVFSQKAVSIYADFAGTSSLSRSHLVEAFRRNRSRFPSGWTADSVIESRMVPSISARNLISTHRLHDIDVLVVDAEGKDWVIVDAILKEEVRPKLILFESRFLSLSALERALLRLVELHYAPFNLGLDTGAILYPTTPIP